MDKLAEALIHEYRELVSLPEVAWRVNEMVGDPDCSVDKLAQLISQDPSLSIRMLGIANSPFYGYSTGINTVNRAVMVLGFNKIRDIVLSAAITKAFDGIPVEIISVDDFWQHSLYCGVMARALTQKISVSPDAAFTAGLVHDIGQLILLHRYPHDMHEIILRTVEGEQPLSILEAEYERLGTTHTAVGAELARLWKLPPYLEATIAWHHEPEKTENFKQEVALIHISNAAAQLLAQDPEEIAVKIEVHPLSWELAGLSREDVPAAAVTACEQFEAVRHMYFQ